MAQLAPWAAQQGRQSSPSPGFHLPSDVSDSGDDDNTPLPFPAALPRSDFLVPDFQPAAYLSALPHRHQTLEDLRSDLRDRSSTISAELLELVNSNYTAFLSLGSELKGGEEKTESVKVSLLGFRRAVEEVKTKVAQRRDETSDLNNELREVRLNIENGRKMLELSDRLSALEEMLSVDSLPEDAKREWDSESDQDDYEDSADGSGSEGHSEGLMGSSPARLFQSARDCHEIVVLRNQLDAQQPFVIKIDARVTKCRNTLLLDLGTAMKEALKAGDKGKDRVLKYLAIFRLLDAERDAVKLLRGK